MFLEGWVNVVSMLPPALLALLGALRGLLWRRAALHAEVIALRHQLLVRAPTHGAKSPFPDGRSDPLGGAVALPARLAPSACARAAGDCDPLAPTRLPPLLALEEQVAIAWTTNH